MGLLTASARPQSRTTREKKTKPKVESIESQTGSRRQRLRSEPGDRDVGKIVGKEGVQRSGAVAGSLTGAEGASRFLSLGRTLVPGCLGDPPTEMETAGSVMKRFLEVTVVQHWSTAEPSPSKTVICRR